MLIVLMLLENMAPRLLHRYVHIDIIGKLESSWGRHPFHVIGHTSNGEAASGAGGIHVAGHSGPSCDRASRVEHGQVVRLTLSR